MGTTWGKPPGPTVASAMVWCARRKASTAAGSIDTSGRGTSGDGCAEVTVEDVLRLALGRLADEGHLSLVEQVDVVGHGEDPVDVLLDDEQRHAGLPQYLHRFEDLVDDDGRQTHRQL